MSDGGRILYIAPDLDHPSGGVRSIYSHVQCLCAAGYDALVVHINPGHVHRWAGIEVPTVWLNGGLRITAKDTVVIPEGCLFTELAALRGVRRTAFVQSCLYAFDGPAGVAGWNDIPFDAALCCSQLTRDFTADILGVEPAYVVPNYVDTEIFSPKPKKFQIAYMPRKNAGEAEFIRKGLALCRPEYASVPWIPVQGMDIGQAAEIMAASAIFLSLCFFEGFNLPPLEAMACGTVPVGYHGYGGLEYARDDNGLWCGHADLTGCIRMLARALDMVEAGGEQLDLMKQNGLETAALFSRDRRDRDLLKAWEMILGAAS